MEEAEHSKAPAVDDGATEGHEEGHTTYMGHGRVLEPKWGLEEPSKR